LAPELAAGIARVKSAKSIAPAVLLRAPCRFSARRAVCVA